MSIAPPDWLALHGGIIQAGLLANSWIVLFDSRPQYVLTAKPAAGKYCCEIMQTINSRRLNSSGTYTSPEEAIRGGLEDLRQVLGW
jgi:hypothetical protein